MNSCPTCQQPIEGRCACPQDSADASRPDAAAPLSSEPPAPNAAFHGVLARGVTHPQIHVDYYAWLNSLPEFDRRFLTTATPHGIAMWAWSRSRETLNEAAKAKNEPTPEIASDQSRSRRTSGQSGKMEPNTFRAGTP